MYGIVEFLIGTEGTRKQVTSGHASGSVSVLLCALSCEFLVDGWGEDRDVALSL